METTKKQEKNINTNKKEERIMKKQEKKFNQEPNFRQLSKQTSMKGGINMIIQHLSEKKAYTLQTALQMIKESGVSVNDVILFGDYMEDDGELEILLEVNTTELYMSSYLDFMKMVAKDFKHFYRIDKNCDNISCTIAFPGWRDDWQTVYKMAKRGISIWPDRKEYDESEILPNINALESAERFVENGNILLTEEKSKIAYARSMHLACQEYLHFLIDRYYIVNEEELSKKYNFLKSTNLRDLITFILTYTDIPVDPKFRHKLSMINDYCNSNSLIITDKDATDIATVTNDLIAEVIGIINSKEPDFLETNMSDMSISAMAGEK